MGLPTSIRVGRYWGEERGISSGGTHVFIVYPLGKRPDENKIAFRVLAIFKDRPWRWKLYPPMSLSGATSMLALARNNIMTGSSMRGFHGKMNDYAIVTTPGRWRRHRSNMADIIERREMEKLPGFGCF